MDTEAPTPRASAVAGPTARERRVAQGVHEPG
jgi:hypothetical protein